MRNYSADDIFNYRICNIFSMVSRIITFLQNIFNKNKHFGNIRTKHESSAPLEWKESFWDKLKKDKLFSPIDINHKSNFKEFRIKIGQRFIIFAINVFLFSFVFSVVKDTYNILKADYYILSSDKIDFSKDIPNYLIQKEQWKIFKLQNYIINKDKNNIQKTTAELLVISEWKQFYLADKKIVFINNQIEVIKSNLFSFLNNLFILFLIYKKKITRQ